MNIELLSKLVFINYFYILHFLFKNVGRTTCQVYDGLRGGVLTGFREGKNIVKNMNDEHRISNDELALCFCLCFTALYSLFNYKKLNNYLINNMPQNPLFT